MTKLATITGYQFAAELPRYAGRPSVPLLPNNSPLLRNIHVRDARYALPKLSWLRGEYRRYFRAELERLDLTKWSPEDNDCDNRADLYRVHAQICKGRMKLGDGLALAVAYIEYFNTRANGWHAINAAAIAPDAIVYIEPSYEYGCDVTHLTAEEQSSIRLFEV